MTLSEDDLQRRDRRTGLNRRKQK